MNTRNALVKKYSPVRELNFTATFSVVVGTVIGGAIFIKAATMTQEVGRPILVICAWIAAGLLSLAGALTYSELGSMLPGAGGDYLYIRTAYGDLMGFLYGWTQIAVAQTGSIAILGTTFALFLSSFLPTTNIWYEHTFHLIGGEIRWSIGLQQVVAIVVILCLSIVNCLGVALGGRVQSALTMAKILCMIFITLGMFLISGSGEWEHFRSAYHTNKWQGMSAFGAAMVSALWVYDGWNCGAMVAGEVKNPGRNIPRALILGLLVVIVIYVLINLGYFYALPATEIITSSSDAYPDALPVAMKATRSFLGPVGIEFVSLMVMLSVLGSLNGAILASARIPFAMARDKLFFSRIGKLSDETRAPIWAIGLQALWASILAISGTFDQLTTFVVFALWIFYVLATGSVFVLRRKLPDTKPSYRTLGYPFTPLIFMLVAGWLLVNTLWTSPIESIKGLVLIAMGLPMYLYFQWAHRDSHVTGNA